MLEKALLVFFRASYAVPRPGHGLQALLLKFLFTLGASAVCAGLDARQRPINQVQQGAVRIGLPE